MIMTEKGGGKYITLIVFFNRQDWKWEGRGAGWRTCRLLRPPCDRPAGVSGGGGFPRVRRWRIYIAQRWRIYMGPGGGWSGGFPPIIWRRSCSTSSGFVWRICSAICWPLEELKNLIKHTKMGVNMSSAKGCSNALYQYQFINGSLLRN